MLMTVDDTVQKIEVPDAVYLILKNHPDHMEPVGTGFAIAPFLLVTAAHVLEEALSIGRGPIAARFRKTGVVGLPILWSHYRFESLYKTELDLGLGIIATEEPTTFALDLIAPSIGDVVFTLGFPDTEYSYEGAENIINVQPAVTTGKIIDFYPEKRDSVFCPFPCYAATMRVPGGLSGGPVFGPTGGVIGVNVSSFSGHDPTCMFVPIMPILLGRLPDPPFGEDSLLDEMGPPPWNPNSMVVDCLNAGLIKSLQNARGEIIRTDETTTLNIVSAPAAHDIQPLSGPVIGGLSRQERRRMLRLKAKTMGRL